jgi:hypothetical protein
MSNDDDLDGCAIVGPGARDDPIADDEITGIVLFADVDPTDFAAVDRRIGEWQELSR